ncbi:hypothetical protein BSLG_000168 [Batrachochytrium salamandrivorans]|nr:hypothetical protein BSLG_000168 [Batrachochytrium salamandrivorans]
MSIQSLYSALPATSPPPTNAPSHRFHPCYQQYPCCPSQLYPAFASDCPVRTLTFKPLYTAEATATGGRNGTVKTPDGLLDLELSLPKGLGGPACFLGALGRVASLSSVQLPKETTVKGVVHIGRHEGALLLEVELKVHAPDFDKTQLMTLIESAHQMCPYSNATRGNVKVHLSVV